MAARKSLFLAALAFFLGAALEAASGLDIRMTHREISAGISPEYNRTFLNSLSGNLSGAVELNGIVTCAAGFEYGALGIGRAGGTSLVNAFASADYRLPLRFPLFAGLSYKHNNLPDYEMSTHTLLPLLSFRTEHFGLSLGMANRWTCFFGETASEAEHIIAFRIYGGLTKGALGFTLAFANYDDFNAQNFGAYFLSARCVYKIRFGLAVINQLALYQSGSSSLAANFYGFAYTGGVSWSF